MASGTRVSIILLHFDGLSCASLLVADLSGRFASDPIHTDPAAIADDANGSVFTFGASTETRQSVFAGTSMGCTGLDTIFTARATGVSTGVATVGCWAVCLCFAGTLSTRQAGLFAHTTPAAPLNSRNIETAIRHFHIADQLTTIITDLIAPRSPFGGAGLRIHADITAIDHSGNVALSAGWLGHSAG